MAQGPRRRTGALWVGFALAALGTFPHTGAAQSCPGREGLQFICGPQGSEDLVPLPHTPWLIASGLNLGKPAHLYWIDTQAKRALPAYPPAPGELMPPSRAVSSSTPLCPQPPDPSRMSTDGLGLRRGPDRIHMLYAANHGDRNAIEFFEVDTRGARPSIQWVGCAPLPPRTLPNAVVPLPGEGLLVTSFYDPTDPRSWERMARGEPTGRILEWHAQSGFRELPGSAVSGANGIELSEDGRLVYLSAWSGRELLILPRAGGKAEHIPLDFMPDNIHRLEDGALLVGGQRTEVARIEHCGAGPCPQPWVLVRVDPRTHRIEPLLSRSGTPEVNYACGGVFVAGELYFTARGSRSLAFLSRADLPSLE